MQKLNQNGRKFKLEKIVCCRGRFMLGGEDSINPNFVRVHGIYSLASLWCLRVWCCW